MKTQWEYRTIKFDLKGTMVPTLDAARFEEQLCGLGLEGWELVSFIPLNEGRIATSHLVAVFKRPR